MKDVYPSEPTIVIEHDQQQFQLDPQSVRALTEIALRNEIGYGAAIAQSIVNQNFLDSHLSTGARLIRELPDGTTRYIDRVPAIR